MLGIGLIGFGRWGPNLARNALLAGCRLAAVADPADERRALAGGLYPDADCSAQWQDLLHHPGVDAVAIATPAHTHGRIAEAALLSGRHVLVEKPMTTDAGEARRLVEIAAARNLCLQVDHTFLYAPSIQAMRQLLEDGRLGQPRHYRSLRQGPRPVACDVDVVWDLAAHDFAIADHLLGRAPRRIAAEAVGTADSVDLTVAFDDGIAAAVQVSWCSPVKVRQATLAGSQGSVSYDSAREGVLLIDGEASPLLNGEETLTAVLRDFRGAIEAGRPPLASGLAGLRVVEWLEAAALSLRLRRPVEL